MSALTAPGIRQSETDPNLGYYPLYAGKAYQGGIAVIKSGYVRPGYVGTGLVAVGIFDFSGDVLEGTLDNTGGSAGDINARVRKGTFRFANYSVDPVLATDIGIPCFIFDDNTVAKTDGGAARSVAGAVKRADANWVWVEIGSVNGTSLAAEIAAREALALDLADTDGTTLADLLNGNQVAEVANANVIGGIEIAHRINVADGVTGDVDVVLTHKTLITGIEVVKAAGAGGANDTITVKNTATAITNAMDINVADKTVVRPTTIDDAQSTIDAGGTLRVTRTKVTSNVACLVIVRGLRVA